LTGNQRRANPRPASTVELGRKLVPADTVVAGAASSHVGRLMGIEGLRAVAASSILIYHVWIYSSPAGPVDAGYLSRFALPHLPVGVTLFFALSGYLLYRPIAASLLATSQVPSVKKYLRNRALRILPAYWVILFVVAVVLPAALLRLSQSEMVLDRLVSRPGILLNNALLVHNYVPASLDTGIGPAWSLAVEVVFYISLPGLALLARYCFRRASTSRGRWLALLSPAAALLLLGSAGKAAPVWLFPRGDVAVHDIIARSFVSHADLFAPGMALAALHVLVMRNQIRLPRHWSVIAGCLLVVDVIAVVALTDRGMLPDWGLANPYQRLTALACVLLVALVVLPTSALNRPSALVRMLEWRPLFLVGLASYSLFLWHEPITRLLARLELTANGRAGFVVNVGVVAAVSGVLAAATYRFVERPALARKVRITEVPPQAGQHTRTPLSPASTPSSGSGESGPAVDSVQDGGRRGDQRLAL
jgi:peptidoglycan/LPS O-acetylase OafA/YrhL